MSTSKKLVSIALTASTIFWAAGIASLPLANAQTTADLQAQIAALLAQIQQLQAQLNGAQGAGTSMAAYNFTRDLTLGSKGADVQALQQFLNAHGAQVAASGAGSPGSESTYFGSLTKAALARFQAAHGISPAAGYFGPITRSFIASMNVGTGTGTGTGTGNGTGTGGTTAPATGLAVGLAADNPAPGSLITSSGGGNGAARVPVLGVNLTAGNSGAVTVSEIKFHKTGVLADSSINGAYLTMNGKVIAQYNSINQGVIDFAGLSLQISAGQTDDIQLAIDVAGGLSAGNTTGFSLSAASDITAWDTANTAVTPSGAFPLNGNTFTVTTVSNPSLATLTITSSSIGTQVTAGTQNNLVGAWVFTGGNSKVWLKSINFRVIGSANKSDIRNVKLFVNGTQVGATLDAVGQDGSAYFDASANPGVINTGSNNVQIFADVMGSPSYNFQFEILNSYDVYAIDSQYNVPVTVTNTSGTGTQVMILQGQITVTQDTGTPTGQIAVGQSGVTLAKFDIYAAGEAVKVKFIGFKLAFTGTTSTISNEVKNVSLVDDAGGQVGTTINTPPSSGGSAWGSTPSGTACDANSGNTGVGTYVDCFGTSGSPINYIVPANTTRVLSLKADVQSTAGFSTVTASLLGESTNLQGLTSGSTGSSSGATGSSLSLSTSLLSTAKNSSYGDQTVTPNSTNVRIGSYAFSASSASGIQVNTLSVKAAPNGSGSSDFQNMKVMVNGAQFGTTQGVVTDASTYTFSGSAFTIPAGQTVNVDVYADILSNATTTSPATQLTGCAGTSVVSFSAVTCSSANGQAVTIQTTGATMSLGLDSSAPAATNLVMGSTGNILSALRFTETSNVESVKITDLTVTQNTDSSNKSAYQVNGVSGLALYNSGTLLGTSNAASATSLGFNYTFHFGTPVVIPQANSLTLTLKGDVASYNSQGATDNSTSTFTLSAANVTALGQSSNLTTVVSGAATSSAMTVLRTTITPSAASSGSTSNRTKSSVDNLATVTFTPNSAGSALLRTLKLTFSGNALATTTVASSSYNSGSYGLVNNLTLLDTNNNDVVASDGASATSSCTSQTACTLTWTFAATPTSSGAFVLSSPYTFTLRLNDNNGTLTAASNNSVTLGATIQSTGDVTYNDSADGTNLSTLISLQSTQIPLQVTNVTFAPGT